MMLLHTCTMWHAACFILCLFHTVGIPVRATYSILRGPLGLTIVHPMIVTGGETNGTARMIKVMNLHIHSVVTGLSYHVLQLLKLGRQR
jgi:hypothetical protein